MIKIAVCGGKACDGAVEELARETGRCIARAGATLFCGGLGGVMSAAAEGAREVGGLTIGILPGWDPAEANPFIEIPIATGIGFARNAIVAYSCDGMVAIGGRYGTLSEIAYALDQRKPVALLESWALTHAHCPGVHGHAVSSPMEAVGWVLAQLEYQRCPP